MYSKWWLSKRIISCLACHLPWETELFTSSIQPISFFPCHSVSSALLTILRLKKESLVNAHTVWTFYSMLTDFINVSVFFFLFSRLKSSMIHSKLNFFYGLRIPILHPTTVGSVGIREKKKSRVVKIFVLRFVSTGGKSLYRRNMCLDLRQEVQNLI